jgi:hypothetical protein
VLQQQLLFHMLGGNYQLQVSPAPGGPEARVWLLPAQQEQQPAGPEAGCKALLEALGSSLLGGNDTAAAAAALGALLWGGLSTAYQQQRLPALEAAALGPEQLQVCVRVGLAGRHALLGLATPRHATAFTLL